LEVLARRAAGSMRDSQSLLEQLLAFAPGRITLDDVHGMLGTAGDQRLSTLVGHLVERDAAAALADLETALGEGVEVAQLLEQLFGYFRDCMAAAVGCPAESFLYASPTSRESVAEAGNRLGLATVLAVMQILDQTLSRLRFSTQGRILAELALVRICALEELDELPALIARIQSGATVDVSTTVRSAPSAKSPPPLTAERKRTEASPDPPAAPPETDPTGQPAVELTPENAAEIWAEALGKMTGMVVEQAKEFDHVAVAGPNRLVISFKPRYALAKSSCERPEVVNRFEKALAEVTGRTIRVQFTLQEDESGGSEPATEVVQASSPHQRLVEVVEHPMVRRAGELFGAQPARVDDPPKRE